MPKGTKEPVTVKARYFRLIRTGMKGAVFFGCSAGWSIDQLRVAVVPRGWEHGSR